MEPANVLKIGSLPNAWRDKDEVILHACFQLLKDFIEQEKEIIEAIDWEYDDEQKKAKAEIDFLYDWWMKKSHDEENLDKLKAQYEEDNEMLKRLIDVRKYLWS